MQKGTRHENQTKAKGAHFALSFPAAQAKIRKGKQVFRMHQLSWKGWCLGTLGKGVVQGTVSLKDAGPPGVAPSPADSPHS